MKAKTRTIGSNTPILLQAIKASNGYLANKPMNREQRRDLERARKRGKK